MKKEHLIELQDIQAITNKLRGISMNESVNFENNMIDEDDFGFEDGAEEEEEEPQSQDVKQNIDDESILDVIREMTLKGMTKLCKTPNDPEFQTLLKIFQICNKKEQSKESDEI